MKSTKRIIGIAILCILALVACNKKMEPIIPETTRVLDNETIDEFSSASDNSNTIVFDQTTPLLTSLEPNNIIVAGVTPQTPKGFLRKIINVQQVAGQVIVETEQATLEDAIEQADISFKKDLTVSSIENAKALIPGVHLRTRSNAVLPNAELNIEIDLGSAVLYDADGNNNTTDDQVTADGSITLTPSIEFDAQIRSFKLQNLSFIMTSEENTEITLNIGLLNLGLNKKIEIARYVLTPITILVGPVPIVFIPELSIYVGVDGSISAGISSRVCHWAVKTGHRCADQKRPVVHYITESC